MKTRRETKRWTVLASMAAAAIAGSFLLALFLSTGSAQASHGRALTAAEMTRVFGDAGPQCKANQPCSQSDFVYVGQNPTMTFCRYCNNLAGDGKNTNRAVCCDAPNGTCNPSGGGQGGCNKLNVYEYGGYTGSAGSCGECGGIGAALDKNFLCDLPIADGTPCKPAPNPGNG